MYNLETMGAKTQFTKLFMAWFHHRQFLWTKLKEGERFYPLFWKQLHAPALSSITSLFKENRSITYFLDNPLRLTTNLSIITGQLLFLFSLRKPFLVSGSNHYRTRNSVLCS
jgi:hypothetical protein